MKLILLPGLDGTGKLFKPFIEMLPENIEPIVVSYPFKKELSYPEITNYIMSKLPKENFVLLCESFSGPAAYQVALLKPKNLKAIIFVASFLENPRPILLSLSKYIPRKLLLSMPTPNFVLKFLMLGRGAGQQILNLCKITLKSVPPKILSFRLGEVSKLKQNYSPCNLNATYIQATNDKLVPQKCLNAFKANLTTVQIEGPHLLMQAKPKACLEAIKNIKIDM